MRAPTLVLAAFVAASGCSSPSGPSVRVDVYPPEQNTSWSPMPAGEPFVVSVLNVCLDGPGEATVDSIDLVDASGIVLTDYAVTPGVSAQAGGLSTLEEAHAGRSETVRAVCDDVAAINVQVERTSLDQPGVLRAYRINWSTEEGRSGSLESLVGLTLCDTCAE